MEPEAQDALARILAVAGLATALLSALIALLAYRRDRHKVAVWGKSVPAGGLKRLEVTVANHGRQPVSIMAAGLLFQESQFQWKAAKLWFKLVFVNRFRPTPLLESEEAKKINAMVHFWSFLPSPHFLSPGEVETFQKDEDEVPAEAKRILALKFREAVPFAQDSYGRVVKSSTVIDMPFPLAPEPCE